MTLTFILAPLVLIASAAPSEGQFQYQEFRQILDGISNNNLNDVKVITGSWVSTDVDTILVERMVSTVRGCPYQITYEAQTGGGPQGDATFTCGSSSSRARLSGCHSGKFRLWVRRLSHVRNELVVSFFELPNLLQSCLPRTPAPPIVGNIK